MTENEILERLNDAEQKDWRFACEPEAPLALIRFHFTRSCVREHLHTIATLRNDAENPKAGRIIHVVFDGPPGPESGRFVEVEDTEGRGISVGEWVQREDGYWALVLNIIKE